MPSSFTVIPDRDYAVTFWCRQGNQAGCNVRTMRTTPTCDAIAAEDVASRIANEASGLYTGLIGGEATFRGVTLKEIIDDPSPFQRSSLVDSTGTGLGSPLPYQTAGMITLYSSLAGRAGRGRVYIPFPAEDDNVDDEARPTAAYVTNAQLLGDFLVGQKLYVVGTSELQFDWTLRPDNFTPGPLNKFLATALARRRWATQRSRGAYGAVNVDPWM